MPAAPARFAHGLEHRPTVVHLHWRHNAAIAASPLRCVWGLTPL
jgi:hypothetical protein